MAKLDCPLLLSPVFKPRIWGRSDPAPPFEHLGHAPPLPGSSHSGFNGKTLIGEVWITDDAARFLSGPVSGLTLGEASRKYGPELLGTSWKHDRFPVLAKYIFTSDWLSIQVHPDDDYARAHDPGNLGKCEMWYIIHAERQAEILLGMKRAVGKSSLRAAFATGNSKQLLHKFHPKAGEAVFVPPGTVHALGPGLVLFEAQQNSDLTYRLDDFGRLGLDGKPRPLHLERGLDVLRPELPPYRDLPRLELREYYGSHRYVLACPLFAVEELTLQKLGFFKGQHERVEVLSVLAGDGRVENAQGWMAYRSGDTWVIPPASGEYRLVPNRKTRVLKCYVPRLDQDFLRPLAKRGVGAAKIKKLVFD